MYITSLVQNLQKLENLPRSRPPGANTLPLSDKIGQILAIDAFRSRLVLISRLRKTSVIVVGHTYRVILITIRRQRLDYQSSPLLASPGRLNVMAGVWLLTVLTAEDLRLSRFFNNSPGEGAPLSTSNATPPIPDG